MDPLLDEKLILTVMRSFSEFIQSTLFLSAEKEAYGPSRNEGLCFESCQSISFSGDINGELFYGMDGYTRIKLLPRIAEKYNLAQIEKGMADSILMEFTNQLAGKVLSELLEGGFSIQITPPQILNHKLVSIDLERNREYIIIFFLRDRRQKLYLGRAYLTLVLRKY